MWVNLLGMAFKTGAKLYSDKQKTKEAMSSARLLQAEKMARGEVEYSGAHQDERSGKDLDPKIQEKVSLFFEHFNNLPFWFQALWVSVCGAIFGIKATDLIKRK